jgi:hypothetical protein
MMGGSGGQFDEDEDMDDCGREVTTEETTATGNSKARKSSLPVDVGERHVVDAFRHIHIL